MLPTPAIDAARLADCQGRPRRRGSRAFTVLELLIVLILIVGVFAISYPAVDQLLRRNRLESATREVASALYAARYLAIRHGVESKVEITFADQSLVTSLDRDEDGSFASRESVLHLPPGVSMRGPGDSAAFGEEALDGFDETSDGGTVVFRPNGSIEAEGALRLWAPTGEFVEVRVSPAATGRVAVRRWQELPGTWKEEGTDS